METTTSKVSKPHVSSLQTEAMMDTDLKAVILPQGHNCVTHLSIYLYTKVLYSRNSLVGKFVCRSQSGHWRTIAHARGSITYGIMFTNTIMFYVCMYVSTYTCVIRCTTTQYCERQMVQYCVIRCTISTQYFTRA